MKPIDLAGDGDMLCEVLDIFRDTFSDNLGLRRSLLDWSLRLECEVPVPDRSSQSIETLAHNPEGW